VNGTGKTTTIGKLAKQWRDQGKRVMLVAADTFRAAATEQLTIWAERTGATIVKREMGADPGAVCHEALSSPEAREHDVILIDTAGRLHTRSNLMEELRKIHRVIQKVMPDAPHETLLVLDATTGQNAVNQAKVFGEMIRITGIIMTKLDGTAKGGVLIAIRDQFDIPILKIGIGEQVEDLRDFDPRGFVDALFEA
jgi:fused signal recognition particle receptor